MDIHKNAGSTHKYSLKKRIAAMTAAALGLLIMLLVLSNLYAVAESNRKIAASNQRALQYSVSQININLGHLDDIMNALVASNNDYLTLFGGADPLSAHVASQNLLESLRGYLGAYGYCDAFFVYSATSDSYRDIFADGYGYARKTPLQKWVRQAVQRDNVSYKDGWIVRKVGGEYHLMRFYGGRGTYLVAVTSFASLSQVGSFSGQQAEVTFCTRDGTPVYGAYTDIDFAAALQSEDVFFDGSPRRMVLHAAVDNSEAVLFLLVGQEGFFNGLSDLQVVFVLLSFLSVLLIPITLLWLRRSLTGPLRGIERTIAAIRSGDLDAETPDCAVREFQDVSVTLNDMTRQIKELKIEAYEQEIAAQKAQLQYLQLQIRPHFYLNCLKGLYAVAGQGNVDKLQRIILSISGHLRYIFRDQLELVPLQQELEHIRNFVEIQRLVSAYPPICRIDVPNSLLDFMIPPLSLSTFVENSCKHRGSGPAEIIVRASVLGEGQERFVDLTVQDNGGGFSEEVLREINAGDEKIYADSHVGLRNIRHRFRLIYGDKVVFAFYNTPCGPVSEIIVPYPEQPRPDLQNMERRASHDRSDC